MVILHLVKLYYGKVDTVILVHQRMMRGTQQQEVRIGVSLADRHTSVAARSVIFLGDDVGLMTDDNWRVISPLATDVGRHHGQRLCTCRERTLIA